MRAASHMRSHHDARKSVAGSCQRINGEETDQPPKLIRYLAEWLQHHTRITSKMLGGNESAGFLHTPIHLSVTVLLP
jgi:hypothetical protein